MIKYISVLTLMLAGCVGNGADPGIKQIQLPAGYAVEIYARVPKARSLALGTGGVVFVGTRQGGKVYAIKPDRTVVTVAEGLDTPNGVAFKDGDLYVAEVRRILKFTNIMSTYESKPTPVPWGPAFPSETRHGWKFIAFGPDGWLYVPVGAPCNLCLEDPNLYAAIHRVSADGSTRELVAKGIRNSVGFDWHPVTGKLWFTENGTDNMGDLIPPCEVNVHLGAAGEHFGYPHCHGGTILDSQFGAGQSCSNFSGPVHKFPAHSAPLGMRFNGATEAFVAEHGSWNRTTPIGYQVTKLTIAGNTVVKAEPFMTGFLIGGKAWGRPVDVLMMGDGSMLVSDDFAGTVYRVTGPGILAKPKTKK